MLSIWFLAFQNWISCFPNRISCGKKQDYLPQTCGGSVITSRVPPQLANQWNPVAFLPLCVNVRSRLSGQTMIEGVFNFSVCQHHFLWWTGRRMLTDCMYFQAAIRLILCTMNGILTISTFICPTNSANMFLVLLRFSHWISKLWSISLGIGAGGKALYLMWHKFGSISKLQPSIWSHWAKWKFGWNFSCGKETFGQIIWGNWTPD